MINETCTISTLTVLLFRKLAGLLLIIEGLSSVNDVNDKLGLDVLKSSSTFDNCDIYKSFLNVLFGAVSVSDVSVLLMLFDGVTIFNEHDDTIAFRHSSGCFVVTRREPLLNDNVRILLLGDFTVFSSPRSSFKGINRRIRDFVFWLLACRGLPEADCVLYGLLILPWIEIKSRRMILSFPKPSGWGGGGGGVMPC